MTASTKRMATRIAVTGCVFLAVGLNVGWWAYDRAAFFLPGVTLRKLRSLKPGGSS